MPAWLPALPCRVWSSERVCACRHRFCNELTMGSIARRNHLDEQDFQIEVLVRAKLALSDGVAMQLTVRSQDQAVSEIMATAVA